MQLIKHTESLCVVCFKKINAEICEKDNKVYLIKNCPDHGRQEVLIWSNAENYLDWAENSVPAPNYSSGRQIDKGCPFDCGYCQDHTGSTCTAVIEVTEKCNMECNVCFASASHNGSDFPFQKIKEMIDYLARTQGFCSLQLSGGECTLRDDLADIIVYAKKVGFKHVQINTNGIRMAEDLEYTRKLKEAGADVVYLGFDSTENSIYKKIRNRDMMSVKNACIKNCEIVNLGVILVPVIIKGVNDNQVGEIIRYAKRHMPVVKGIHFQPASQFGRYELGNSKNEDRYTFPDLINDMVIQTEEEISELDIVPRKKSSSYCSFSSSYYLNEDNRLIALTKNDGVDEEIEVNSCSCKEEKMSVFARKTNDFTERFWRQNTVETPNKETNLTKFNKRIGEYSLAISAMPFQDIWNIDLERLKGCCVSVIDPNLETIPLCLYYLTNIEGDKLYGGGKCLV